jgi:hypothetical protein
MKKITDGVIYFSYHLLFSAGIISQYLVFYNEHNDFHNLKPALSPKNP